MLAGARKLKLADRDRAMEADNTAAHGAVQHRWVLAFVGHDSQAVTRPNLSVDRTSAKACTAMPRRYTERMDGMQGVGLMATATQAVTIEMLGEQLYKANEGI